MEGTCVSHNDSPLSEIDQKGEEKSSITVECTMPCALFIEWSDEGDGGNEDSEGEDEVPVLTAPVTSHVVSEESKLLRRSRLFSVGAVGEEVSIHPSAVVLHFLGTFCMFRVKCFTSSFSCSPFSFLPYFLHLHVYIRLILHILGWSII